MLNRQKIAILALWVLVSTGETALSQMLTTWEDQESGTVERLRGVAAVDSQAAWASGHHGTILRTVNGGLTWAKLVIPAAGELDFRDVEASDPSTAHVLSIGPGDRSRIYRTTDGGHHWSLSYQATDARWFLDAIAFWDRDRGLALGDPVDGRFVVLETSDGGKTWRPLESMTMPTCLPGEGAFAASGTCLVAAEKNQAWFVTGGGSSPRVFHTTDNGRTWEVAAAPIKTIEPSEGLFSVAFDPPTRLGLAVGGDYRKVDGQKNNCFRSVDLGETWQIRDEKLGGRPGGFRSAVAILPGSQGRGILAVGPSGSDFSEDGGLSWKSLASGEGFHAMSVEPGGRVAWAVGEGGKIARLRVRP